MSRCLLRIHGSCRVAVLPLSKELMHEIIELILVNSSIREKDEWLDPLGVLKSVNLYIILDKIKNIDIGG